MRSFKSLRAVSTYRPFISLEIHSRPPALSRDASSSSAQAKIKQDDEQMEPEGLDGATSRPAVWGGAGISPKSRLPRRQWSSFDLDYERPTQTRDKKHERPSLPSLTSSPSASTGPSTAGAGRKAATHSYRHGQRLAPWRKTPTGVRNTQRTIVLAQGTASEPLRPLECSHTDLQRMTKEYYLSDILAAVHEQALHPVAVWPRDHIMKALGFIPTHESMLQLVLIAQRSLPHMDPRTVPRLGQRLLGRMGAAHILAPLPGTINLILQSITRAVNRGFATADPVELEDLLKWFIDLLVGLQYFRQRPRHGAPKDVFHPLIRTQVLKVTRCFIDFAGRYPSSSTGSPLSSILTRRSLNLLVMPGFMSAELSLLLREHVSESQLSLSVSRYLLRQALADGDQLLAATLKDKVDELYANGSSLSKHEEEALEAFFPEDFADELIAAGTGQNEDDFAGDERVTATARPTDTKHLDTMVFDLKMLSTKDFYDTYKQQLHKADGDVSSSSLSQHLWHRLSVTLYRQAWRGEVDSDSIGHFYRLIPEDAISAETVSPLISAYVRVRSYQSAMQLWDELHHREGDAVDDEQGRFVSPRVIAALTPAFCALYKLEEVVQFVDTWATRRGVLDETTGRTAKWFAADKANLNALLIACKESGDLRMAYRLFSAARSRWRVVPDDIALSVLLQITISEWRHDGPRPAGVHQSRPPTLRDMFFAPKDSTNGHALSCYDRKYWTHDLDQAWKRPDRPPARNPLFSQSTEEEDEAVGNWRTAHRLFREVILGNWPSLTEVKSPLGRSSSVASAFFGSASAPTDNDLDATFDFPSPDARYTSILPEASVFGRYINFLCSFGLIDEVPVVLAWMRALHIRPEWRDMRKALMYISEFEGPRRLVAGPHGPRLLRDEQIMREWLEGWLGADRHTWKMLNRANGENIEVTTSMVPSEVDVQNLRRRFMAKGQKLKVVGG